MVNKMMNEKAKKQIVLKRRVAIPHDATKKGENQSQSKPDKPVEFDLKKEILVLRGSLNQQQKLKYQQKHLSQQ